MTKTQIISIIIVILLIVGAVYWWRVEPLPDEVDTNSLSNSEQNVDQGILNDGNIPVLNAQVKD